MRTLTTNAQVCAQPFGPFSRGRVLHARSALAQSVKTAHVAKADTGRRRCTPLTTPGGAAPVAVCTHKGL